MILVDTSVWVDHLRNGDAALAGELDRGTVVVHPFVVGELACGNLHNRGVVLELLQRLPTAPVATHPEVLAFIEARDLMGRGIGYVDAHVLAATALGADMRLWSRDKRLAEVARTLGVAFAE